MITSIKVTENGNTTEIISSPTIIPQNINFKKVVQSGSVVASCTCKDVPPALVCDEPAWTHTNKYFEGDIVAYNGQIWISRCYNTN